MAAPWRWQALSDVTGLPDLIRLLNTRLGQLTAWLGEVWFRLTNDGVLNVLDYGADPTGVRSLHTAVANAFADLPAGGGVVYVPRGLYNLTASLIPPASNAFQNSSHVILRFDPNAVIRPTTTDADFVAIDTTNVVQADGKLILEGGVLSGVNCTGAAATTAGGVRIRPNNVTVRDMTIMLFGGDGVQYAVPSLNFPLVSRLLNCNIYWNGRRGVYAPVGASGLVAMFNRIEQNGEEGFYGDGAGKISVCHNVIENNGRLVTSSAQVRLRNSVDGSVDNNYLESDLYQPNPAVLVEGVTSAPNALSICRNRCVGSYETALGSGVALTAAVAIDLGGGGGGAIQGVVAKGNKFFGQYSGVRIGTGVTGYEIGPDQFTDNYANSFVTPPCPRYQRLSTLPGIVYDINRHENKIYAIGAVYQALAATTIDASGLITAALGMLVTGGTQAAGKIWKSATLGLVTQGVAGSTSDLTDLTPGAAAIREVPTGTIVQQAFGSIQESAVTIAYSASMTPNAGTGTTASSSGNIQTITATNGTAFTINAPTGPRAGMRLRLRIRNTSGGALGVATWNAVFKMVAWVQPATGFSRSIDFDYDGTNWVEAYRSAADVAN